jgi:hypothetical protein
MCCTYQDTTVSAGLAVRDALRHRNELHQAIRALGPSIAKRMAYWYQIRDQITEGYAGKIFEDHKPVTDVEQKKRVDEFLGWERGVERAILRLEKQWMGIHGVDHPWDPGQQWITTATLGAKGGTAAPPSSPPMLILNGEELPLPEDITYDSILFAHHLRLHAETFGLPLPEDQEKVEKTEAPSEMSRG